MRNIFIFIRVYFTFLFFLFLMGVSLYMLFTYNRYHHTVYSAVANEATGTLSTQYNKIQYYFQLKRTNDSLVKANETLYNKLKQDFELPDTTSHITVDSLKNDTIASARKFLYLSAKVVRNSVNQQNNYIIVHRGSQQGINADMGVIDPNNAVVGTVMDVSNNFAVVMSLLHEQSNLSARLKKSGETGTIIWDGLSPKIILLKDISKSVKISAGDTVVTSGFSDKFPAGLLVGYVKDIINDKSSSTYTVRLHPAANFQTLQYTYIIKNFQAEEPLQLLKKITNK
jgi:rod shape-determining protein MreC